MAFFTLDISDSDSSEMLEVTEHFVVYSSINYSSEWFGEKGYTSEKLWPHQEYYDHFRDKDRSRPIIEFLVSNKLVKPHQRLFIQSLSLKLEFENLVESYLNKDRKKINSYWKEIQVQYSNPSRHYHTLPHLRNLLAHLTASKKKIADWEVVAFATFYHDIVYDVSRSDNEEKSAEWAARVMSELKVEQTKINRCVNHILATKAHTLNDDPDTNLFTDSDLAILGVSEPEYTTYAKAIRMEYSIYPDEVYIPGRKKAIESFLKRNLIYHTIPFQEMYEANARLNIQNEIDQLH